MTKKKIELWNRKEKEEYEFLDSIDVRRYLVNGAEVEVCMDAIKQKYNEEYCKKYNDDYGLFNYIDTDDFLDYIYNRYPDINYYESTSTRYYIWNPNDREKKK